MFLQILPTRTLGNVWSSVKRICLLTTGLKFTSQLPVEVYENFENVAKSFCKVYVDQTDFRRYPGVQRGMRAHLPKQCGGLLVEPQVDQGHLLSERKLGPPVVEPIVSRNLNDVFRFLSNKIFVCTECEVKPTSCKKYFILFQATTHPIRVQSVTIIIPQQWKSPRVQAHVIPTTIT